MATLQDSHTTNINNSSQLFGINWLAQEFLTTSAYTITSVKLKLGRVGAPGIVTASIRASSSGLPTGADLVSGTYDGDTLGGFPGTWVEFDFGAGYSLSDATKYVIVLRATTGDNSNYIWFGTSTDSGYPDGKASFSANSGGTWTLGLDPGKDHGFETYGTGGTVYAEGTKTVTAAGSASLTSQLLVMTEGTKVVAVAASVSLTVQAYKSNTGFPADRPSDYDPDLYWDETAGTWSSTRTVGPGNWAQYVVAASEEGEIYFGTV